METIPAQKRQRLSAAAIDVQADTAEVLSGASQDSRVSTGHIIQPADVPSPQSKPRKAKALPVPQLVKPGSAHERDVWDCAVLLVDKPQTWTSFDVCGKLKYVLKVKKIGHAGTLDPMATGLLIICTGKGTKSIDSFQAMHKEYSGTMKLGEATDSYDAEGQVVEQRPWDHLTLEQLQEKASTSFVGDLQQVPPMFSALHVKGKRLYELAREGKVVERAARPVNISRFELTQDEADPQRVHFYIACSKGTYIRSLAHDLASIVPISAQYN